MLKEISNEIRSAFQSNQNGVTQLLILNIAIFLLVGTARVVTFFAPGLGSVDQLVLDYLGLSSTPFRFIFFPWTLFTYGIVHLDIWHLIFNMMGLYMFGQILQLFLGPKKVLNFYFFGTVAGGLLFLLIFSLIGKSSMAATSSSLLGASGAVYGIICGAAFLVPNYTVNLLLIGPVRLKYIAIAFVLISFVQIPYGNPGGNIAHIGGALGGILYLRFLQGGFQWKRNLFKGPVQKGKVVRMETRKPSIPSEVELDELLDKINEKGIHSLTKEERNRLEILSKPGNTNE